MKKRTQRACDEKVEKGKLCCGHLKRWYDYPKGNREADRNQGGNLSLRILQDALQTRSFLRPAQLHAALLGRANNLNRDELIYDWNTAKGAEIPPGRRVALNDETLRDGLQNPSVHDPTIAEKIEILHLMEALEHRDGEYRLARRRAARLCRYRSAGARNCYARA